MTRPIFALALALLPAGCGDDPVPAPPAPSAPTAYAGTLSVDIRGSIQVRIDLGAARATAVDLRWGAGDTLAVLGAATQAAGEGRHERFPEADAELYTAKLSLPPDPSGICGAKPIALALSLTRSGANVRAAGSLTAYCGGEHHGVPARIFRLAGDLSASP